MNMLTENRVRSTSFEQFRKNQAIRKGHSSVEINEIAKDNEVTWKQIFRDFGVIFAGGIFFIFLIFGLAFLSILF